MNRIAYLKEIHQVLKIIIPKHHLFCATYVFVNDLLASTTESHEGAQFRDRSIYYVDDIHLVVPLV